MTSAGWSKVTPEEAAEMRTDVLREAAGAALEVRGPHRHTDTVVAVHHRLNRMALEGQRAAAQDQP